MAQQEIALIVGAGPGLSASLGRLFYKEGMKVALAPFDEVMRSLRDEARPRLPRE